MKQIFYFSFCLVLISAMLVTTGCSDDDDVVTCLDGIQNGDETGIDCGGSACAVCPTCVDGIQNGDETGIDCGGTACDACLIGIQGQWQSSGTNVAPLLANFLNVDSLWADFRSNFTYTVNQFDKSGVMTVLEGTYAQNDSGTDDIWTITVNQTSPAAFTSSGMFKVTSGAPDMMQYEIVIEDGVNVPPTPSGGFGSTNGGALGTANVQVYLRTE